MYYIHLRLSGSEESIASYMAFSIRRWTFSARRESFKPRSVRTTSSPNASCTSKSIFDGSALWVCWANFVLDDDEHCAFAVRSKFDAVVLSASGPSLSVDSISELAGLAGGSNDIRLFVIDSRSIFGRLRLVRGCRN